MADGALPVDVLEGRGIRHRLAAFGGSGNRLAPGRAGVRRGKAIPHDPEFLRRFTFLGLTVPELIGVLRQPEWLDDQPYWIVGYAMVGPGQCSDQQLRFDLAPDDELVRDVAKETIVPGRFIATPPSSCRSSCRLSSAKRRRRKSQWSSLSSDILVRAGARPIRMQFSRAAGCEGTWRQRIRYALVQGPG
jgi:hypothetical protein